MPFWAEGRYTSSPQVIDTAIAAPAGMVPALKPTARTSPMPLRMTGSFSPKSIEITDRPGEAAVKNGRYVARSTPTSVPREVGLEVYDVTTAVGERSAGSCLTTSGLADVPREFALDRL